MNISLLTPNHGQAYRKTSGVGERVDTQWLRHKRGFTPTMTVEAWYSIGCLGGC